MNGPGRLSKEQELGASLRAVGRDGVGSERIAGCAHLCQQLTGV